MIDSIVYRDLICIDVGMCRQFPGYWDKLCASCDGTLKEYWSETEKEMPIPQDLQTTSI